MIKLMKLFAGSSHLQIIKEITEFQKFQWLLGNDLYEAILNG
jgi:hypothetical protein